jgi:hypothetical protein
MPIKTRCPSCQVAINAADQDAGKFGRCPKCGGAFIVPQPDDTAAPPLEVLAVPEAEVGGGASRSMRRSGAPPWVWVLVGAGGILILEAVVALAFVAKGAAGRPSSVPAAGPPEEGFPAGGSPAPREVVEIADANDKRRTSGLMLLYYAYANVVAADARYLDRVVVFEMRDAPARTWKEGGRYFLGFCTRFGAAACLDVGVVCELLPQGAERYAKGFPDAKPGSRLRIRGVCKGAEPAPTTTGYAVRLVKCEIEPKE